MFDELVEKNDPTFLEAARLRSEEQKTIIDQTAVKLAQQVLAWVTILLVIWLVQLYFPLLGSGIHKDYFSAMAQVYPILLIALYLSSGKQPSPTKEKIRLNFRHFSNVTKKIYWCI